MIRTFLSISFIILLANLNISAQESIQGQVWTLENCIRHAIENNIQVKQQEIQTMYQENTLLQSKLGLLPSLNSQANNTYSFGRPLDQSTNLYTQQNVASLSLNAGANVILFNGLQQYNTIKRNTYALEAGMKDLEAMKESIALTVALGYLQILLNKELVIVTENQLTITREQIEKTRKLVDAGSLAAGNLLDIQAQAAREEVQLINNENQLQISYLNLTQLLELESPEGFEVIVPEYTVESDLVIVDEVNQVYSESESIRPAISAAELRLQAAEQELSIAKGGWSPRLSLSTSFNTVYSDARQKILGIDTGTGEIIYGEYPFNDQISDNINYGIGLSLSIPIFNGWQVNTSIKNSKLNIQNSRYEVDAAKKQLYKNIQQAFADASGSLKAYKSSQTAVNAMEESFRYTEQKFNVGIVTPVEYNTAKTQLLNAQSELAQSKYQFLFKTKVLDFYRGIPLTLEN